MPYPPANGSTSRSDARATAPAGRRSARGCPDRSAGGSPSERSEAPGRSRRRRVGRTRPPRCRLRPPHRLHERTQAGGGLAEIAVAEDEHGLAEIGLAEIGLAAIGLAAIGSPGIGMVTLGAPAIALTGMSSIGPARECCAREGRAGGGGHCLALSDHMLATHHRGAGGAGALGGRVGGAVVGDPHGGVRERMGQAVESRGDPVGLVEGGDDDEGVRAHEVRREYPGSRWSARVPPGVRPFPRGSTRGRGSGEGVGSRGREQGSGAEAIVRDRPGETRGSPQSRLSGGTR